MADIINVPNTMQKVMFKALTKENMSLRQVGVVKGSKVMVVGSTLSDVLEMAKKPSAQEVKEAAQEEAVKENLPMVPLAGMHNKTGGR